MRDSSEPANISLVFQAHAQRKADRRFLKIRRQGVAHELTFSQILHLAEAYNFAFRARSLPPGSVVAVILDPGEDLCAALLGAMMAGCVPTILPCLTAKQNPDVYWTSHAKLFALSGIDSILTFADNADAIRESLGGQIKNIWTREEIERDRRSAEFSHNDTALLQHSSGTTGLKKGVMLSHAAIANQVRNYSQTIGLVEDSRVVSWLPLYHDMGLVACLLTPMIVGCEASHLDPLEWSAKPTLFLDELVSFKGDFGWQPNFAFNHIVNSIRGKGPWDLAHVRAIINCSEPCKAATFAQFRDHPALASLPETALQTCYAMAENVFAVTQNPLSAPPRELRVNPLSLHDDVPVKLSEGERSLSLLSCGSPIEGVDVAIIGADGSFARDERRFGEIAISGDSLYSGYYKRPVQTARRLVDGWHRTGDLGFLWDGELYITGRIDDLLVVRGKKIHAHEVEDVVNRTGLALPGRVVAFSVADVKLGTDEMVVACELEDPSPPPSTRLKLRDAVEAQTGVAVGKIVFLPKQSLIKTTSGKISRELNRMAFLEREYDR